jgi:hypothetical protein
MAAREDLLNRVAAIRHAVTESQNLEVLKHQLPTSPQHETSRLFRNGLAVAGFAVLEDFLKARATEVLARCSGCSLPFEDLPDALQRFSTRGVVNAIRVQVDLRARRGEDFGSLIRATGRALASTGTPSYELSELAFGQARSNLGPDDVKEFMGAFRIQDGWGSATLIAQRMGFSSLSLRDDFQAAAIRRHSAAHEPGAETALGDLQALPAQVLGIAAAFDALLSRAASRLVSGDRKFAESGKLDPRSIAIRFVENDGTVVREVAEGKKRATARAPTVSQLLPASRKRAHKNREVLVISERKIPVGWEVTDL